MAQLGTSINPDEIEAGRGFGTFPAGEYMMQIIENTVQAAGTGKGQLLVLTWEVMEGEHEKSRLWENVNFLHDSAKCQLIGQQHIKAICDAVGFAGLLEDADVLMFIPCRVRVGIEPGKPKPADKGGGNYDDKNKILKVSPLGAAAPAGKPATAAPKPAATAAAKPAAATTAASKPATAGPTGSRPWAKTA